MGPVVDIANSSSHQFSVSKMERNHKRRGFMKIMFSVVAAKPSAPAQCSTKVKPSPPPTQSAHVGCQGFYKEDVSVKNPSLIMSKTSTFSEAKPVAGFHGSSSSSIGVFDSHSGDFGGDEDVDMKAAKYISNVRERFKLVNADLDQRMR
jgi:hypothetical protein